jgi:hypothetical protein
LFATVIPEKLASQELDASVGASGPHDFAVRVSAVRQKRISVHHIPCPRFVTIAKRPFVWAGMEKDVQVIWVKKEQEYFCEEDWTTQITLESLGKSSSEKIRNSADEAITCIVSADATLPRRQPTNCGRQNRPGPHYKAQQLPQLQACILESMQSIAVLGPKRVLARLGWFKQVIIRE